MGTPGKCYIILAGTTVLSGGPNWEKYLREKNLCRQQSRSRRSTHNSFLGVLISYFHFLKIEALSYARIFKKKTTKPLVGLKVN